MSVKIDNANIILKDIDGNTGVIKSLTDNDVSTLNTALSDVSDLKSRVKAVEDSGYVSYNSVQSLDEEQCAQAQANMDAPGLSLNNTFTGKQVVEADVKANSFTLNTRFGIANLAASTNTAGIKLIGATSDTNGASLELIGSSDSANPQFDLSATGTYILHGDSNGTLTWNGDNVVRSVNGVEADDNGNVSLPEIEGGGAKTVNGIGADSSGNITLPLNFLPLEGGALTGNVIRRNVDNSSLSIVGASQYSNGAYLQLFGSENSEIGRFVLCANDGTTEKFLVGSSDGSLTWNGKMLVRTINGVGADRLGNVTISNVNIVGEVIFFARSTAPNGYLVCNGAEVSRTTYASLFSAIGTTYGSGDGSTTFNLPNLINRFAQGSTTVGTYLAAGLPNITGDIGYISAHNYSSGTNLVSNSALSWAYYANSRGTLCTDSLNPISVDINLDLSKGNSIYGNSTTVQPPALTLLPCIKY